MSSLLVSLADGAAGAASGGPMGAGGPLNQLGLLAVMFAIFYFLVIRPQSKKQKEHADWLRALKKGEEVVTTGGLWGKISVLNENEPYVTLELQDKIRVKVLRSHIAAKAPTTNAAAAAVAPTPETK